MQKLTPNEHRALSFITDFIRANGKSPTLVEIKIGVGWNSINTVQRAVESLVKKDYLIKAKNMARGLDIENKNRQDSPHTIPVPIIGTVACGSPVLAFEDVTGFIPTDADFLHGDPDDYFYLRASGDSMDKSGINDGDLVLIRKQSYATDGEKVVALVDDSATIKYLHHGSGFVALDPDSTNPNHKPIILRDDFRIQGVVIKVIGKS